MINPLTALFNIPNGKILDLPDYDRIANEIVKEGVTVASQCGIELDLNDMIEINKELQNYSIKGICVTDEYNNNNGAICKFRMDCKVHVYYNTL